MSTITLPNIRVSSDLTVSVRLKDNGVAIDWSTLNNVKASIYSDAQRALAGRCDVSVNAEDPTVLVCQYAANKPQYVGVCRIVVSAKYMGETKTYDKPAFNFVRWTADQDGEQITIDDPDVDVEIDVADVSSSLLDEAIRAAFTAAEEAVDAKDQVLETEAEVEAAEALRVSAEESRVEAEEGRAEAEAARVDEEAVRVSAEDARVVAENARAAAEDLREGAEDDRAAAETARETAEAARVAAEALRVTAEGSRETAEAAREAQASADHTVAAGDHTQAAADHTQAAADHTTAASDHTQAEADHTLAAADHVTAGEDHAQAQDDHEVMEGYDTRLGSVESEVSQLEAKVDEKIDGLEQNAVAGKYINSSGVEMNIGSGTVIGFLPYSSGDVVWKYGTRNANYALCFYDSDKQLLNAFTTISNNAIKERTITASEIATSAPGAAFLKASLTTADGQGVVLDGKLILPNYETVVGIEQRASDLEGEVQDLQDADTALSGRIDSNDADIDNLQEKDVEIEGRLENIEGPYISPDNGVGGVTSSTKITQGGALVSVPFDFSRPFVYEAVLKPQNGSTVAILNLLERYGNQSRLVAFRIHNGAFQFSCFFGSTSQYPITQSFQNALGLVFGQWYHLCVVYDGTAVYLFANGVQRYKNEIVITQSDANSTGGCESDSLHSPKLLRLCNITIPEGKTAQDVALAHYNGGNPFGYDSSNDELYIEILPANMLKTSIKNTANDVTVTYATEKTFDIQTENPWAAVIEGAGVPATVPVYKWQKYKDTTTGKVYTAKGNETVSDWVYQATSEDLLALRTQTKTVGGQSIWGTGDIPAGSGSGSGTFVSVADFGATGDGVTDDTTALQTALEYARANNRALYFPNGTFLTRKGFVLTSGMHVTGEPDAIIQNAAATIEGGGKCPYTTTTADAAQGDHSVVVTDASKFRVGDEIVIWKSGSYTETMADITAINGNTITFDTSRFTADGTDGGLLNAVASAGYVLTDFAMFKTVMTKAAVNVVVENITIKPMSDMNEPHIYTSSPISQTKQGGGQPQSNFRVYNVTCYDSANDGISLQGTGDSEVIGCRVFGQKHKGIHFGTSHDKIVISKNYCYGCGSAQYENFSDYQGSGAIFFCSNNHRVIITDNIFENCYKGVYGFNYQGGGEQDTDTIIANNTFKNCGLYGLMLRGGYRAVVVGNIFTDFNNSAIPIHTEAEGNFKFTAGVISNNVFGNFGSAFAGPAIQVTGARNLVLAGNNVSGYVNNNASTVRDHCDITVATSEKVAITNNVVDGVIDISDAGNTGIVKDNNIETS